MLIFLNLLSVDNFNDIVCDLQFKILLNNLLYSHELLPVATAIFLAGLAAYLESDNFISLLINTEICMLGVNFHIITSSLIWGDIAGQVYTLSFLAATAAETAVGLSFIILLYRTKGKTSFEEVSSLKG